MAPSQAGARQGANVADDGAPTVRASRVVYENRWMRVREDDIVRPDGSPGIYGVVEKPDFALVIPVDTGGLWLVEQYRYPVGRRFLEFPQGSWENRPATDPAVLAAAELREETGLLAGRLHHLGHLFTASGFSNQGCDVWLATDLTEGPRDLEVEEQDLVARRFGFDAWAGLLARGAIRDVNTLAAWALLCARPPVGFALPRAARCAARGDSGR